MRINSIETTVQLHNGVEMPMLGLGTWQAKGDAVKQAVRHALEVGYRHIDTAAAYRNEQQIGEALDESGVDREQVFITSKLANPDTRAGRCEQAFEATLERLGVDYLDLYLIHWPTERFAEAWATMEKLAQTDKLRAIGVSNFLIHHLKELDQAAEIVPMVNQVEYHPHLQQPDLLKYNQDRRIVHEAWSPIIKGEAEEIEPLQAIGETHGKTAVQVTLRWELQKGVVTIPKSTNMGRIEQNADVFDFELSEEEMAAIDALDRSRRTGPDPDDFDF